MLVFVVVFYIFVGRAFSAVGITEREVFEIIEMWFQRCFACAFFAHVGEGDVGSLLALLRHTLHRVALGSGLIGSQVSLQIHVGIQRVILRTADFFCPVNIQRDVHAPFLRQHPADFEVKGRLHV